MKGKQKRSHDHNEDDSDSVSDDETTFDTIDVYKKRKVTKSDERIQWVEKYSPKISKDICINPRKLRDLRDELCKMINGDNNNRLLVLTGPSGSSKSTSVKVVASELIRHSNSSASGFGNYFEMKNEEEYFNEYIDSSIDSINQTNVFTEFMNDSKFKTNTVILIEDLPNIFHNETLQKFRKSIQDWIFTSSNIKLPPLVLCITEIDNYNENTRYEAYNIENNFTAETLLGKDILNNPVVKVIKFNPIASSFMNKVVRKIITKEYLLFSKIPKKEIEAFVTSMIDIGDIRSMISNLEYWASSKSRTQYSSNLEINFKREQRINLFHATGKIIYSSSKFKHLENEDDQDFKSVETVIDNFVSNNSNLMRLSLLENYPLYNNMNFDIKTASDISDYLSIGDTLNFMEEGIDVSVRGTRNKLRSIKETTSKQGHLKFPREFKMNRLRLKSLFELNNYRLHINKLRDSVCDINLIQGYLIPEIYNSFRYKFLHKKQGNIKYNRIGGIFKEVYADMTPDLDEDNPNELQNDFNQDQFKIEIRKNIESAQQEDKRLEDDSDELSDPIEESDPDSDEIFDDSFDDELNDLMNKQGKKSRVISFTNSIVPKVKQEIIENDSDVFLSDPELEQLISQGKL